MNSGLASAFRRLRPENEKQPQPTVGGLGIDNMELVREAFQSAYTHMAAHVPANERTDFYNRIGEIVLVMQTEAMFGAGTIEYTRDSVFSDGMTRRIINGLTFGWISRWGGNISDYAALCDTLALSIGYMDSDFSLVPKEILDRTSSVSEINAILQANQWMVTILLIKLCLTFNTEG